MLLCGCYDYVSFKVSWIWLVILLIRNSARASRQQTAHSVVTSLCSRHLKGKGKGLWAREECEEWSEGGSDFNIHLVDVHTAKNNSLLAGISLPPLVSLAPKTHFPLHLKCLPHRLTDLTQSFYPFTLVNIYQAICIFWWLEVKYVSLDHWMYFWYWKTKAEKMVTRKGKKKWNNGTVKSCE